LYDHFVETPLVSEPCTAFLERAASGDLEVFTSLHVLAEAIHKVMVAEAEQAFGRTRAGLVGWLQRNSHRIAELSHFQRAATHLAAMRLHVLPADASDLVQASVLSAQCGLLTNDALVVAIMRRHSLANLVTNDDDFDDVTGLTIWKPR
jgi:predicted nucleic acid-binding protein